MQNGGGAQVAGDVLATAGWGGGVDQQNRAAGAAQGEESGEKTRSGRCRESDQRARLRRRSGPQRAELEGKSVDLAEARLVMLGNDEGSLAAGADEVAEGVENQVANQSYSSKTAVEYTPTPSPAAFCEDLYPSLIMPRVVITGLGAVSPWGWGVEALWRGLGSGTTGLRPAERFDTTTQRTRIAGEVPAAPPELVAAWPGWQRLSRADRFALAAAVEACAQAGLAVPFDPGIATAVGIFFGGSTAGMAEAERFFHRITGAAAGHPRLVWLASHQINGPSDAVARHLRTGGPVLTLSSACASGGLALGSALDAVRSGEVEIALAGGADSLCQLTYAGFNALRSVDEQPCRPFARDRAGLSIGEGGAVMVLERLEHARARGARPLCELVGAGASCDAHHMTAPQPQGTGAAAAIRAALADAGACAEEVDFVNAHGTGTPLNDAAEWQAFENVFEQRARSLPVTATKASVGHLLGSAGAFEALVTALCLLRGEIHPTPGDAALDDDLGIDLVRSPRPLAAGSLALSTSLAFGGANAALLLRGIETGGEIEEGSRS